MTKNVAALDPWPDLPLEAWKDTYATLHMWTQIVGKTCLALAPPQNHWWHIALRVTARGLATGPMLYGSRTFDAEFDFIEHELVLRTSEGAVQKIALRPRSVAEFYRAYLAALKKLDVQVKLWPVPVEVEHPIRFPDDETHAAYDPEYANRHWRILVQADDVLRRFRAPFLGKCSPVHFFWGSFDLAVTRFSGRRAPERPGADRMTQEAYSHEVISRVLGRKRGRARGCVLRVCRARAGGPPRPRPAAQLRVLPSADGDIHPALCRGPHRHVAGRRAAGVPPKHLRRRGRPRALGPGGARAPRD